MDLAPLAFSSTASVEKMKEFIVKFLQSDEVKKEVASVNNIS
jgi:hypothetical protein